MTRLTEIAARFAFGFFVVLGVLTISNRFANSPDSFATAAFIAALGGLLGAGSAIRR